MYKPRIMHVVRTEYFDFLFSSHSTQTVRLLAEKGDVFYEEAEEHLRIKRRKHIPVVISPDTDLFSVEYISNPYQKIVIYEAQPDFLEGDAKTALLNQFRDKIYVAVATKAKNYARFKNLPFSFIEGFSYAEEGFRDRENPQNNSVFEAEERTYNQLLSQAKLDNCFPSWFQASAQRDVYPYNKVNLAAAAAFSGYLIDNYGFDKYLEFWEEAGKLNLFKATRGIFKTVYNTELSEEWKNFKETIPLPDQLQELQKRESASDKIFAYDDNGGFYKYSVNTSSGIAWYDDFRHEIDFCHQFSIFKLREIFGWAENVTNLTASTDGNFLAVSHVDCGSRSNFEQEKVRIYDIKKRAFLSEVYRLRDGQIFLLPDLTYAVCGVYIREKSQELRIYSSNKINKKYLELESLENPLLYKKVFSSDCVIQSPVPYNNGLLYLVKKDNKTLLAFWDYKTNVEKFWDLGLENVCNLRIYDFKKQQYSVNYNQKQSFNRIAIINLPSTLSDFIELQVQTKDFPGGVNSPLPMNNDIFYCAEKFDFGELRHISQEHFSFENKTIASTDFKLPEYPLLSYSKISFSDLSNYRQALYNPLKYQYKGSAKPLMPILNFDVNDGIKYWPGLGFTYKTKTDILDNKEFGISASTFYFPMQFNVFMKNLTVKEQLDYVSRITDLKENYSFAGYFNNSSTPVDITGGSIFKFNKDGYWNWESLLGVDWRYHIRLPMNVLHIGTALTHSAGTDYFDPVLIDSHPDLAGWCSYNDSYKTVQLSLTTEYSNIHNYGFSEFQKSGVYFGANFYCLWDYYEHENTKEKWRATGYYPLLDWITQINGNYYITGYIPAVNSLQNRNGWIINMPTVLHLDFFDRTGKAMEGYCEVLLLGKEIQNGYAPTFIFFNRAGLKVGYDYSLIYDADNLLVPDLRTIHEFYDIFTNTSVSQFYYAKINLDFVPVLGQFSTYEIKSEFVCRYYPVTKGFAVTFNAKVEM